MITGLHALIYTTEPDAARAFFRDTLGFDSVDAGEGWLIFAMPPAELGVHPTDEGAAHELCFLCDDVEATIADLERKGVEFTQPVEDQGFGLVTRMKIPGGEISLYQPRHPSPIAVPHEETTPGEV